MSRFETSSRTGQGEPAPCKEERDAAFSSGGGRRADAELTDRAKPKPKCSASANEDCVTPPIGLEMETRAGKALHEASQVVLHAETRDEATDDDSDVDCGEEPEPANHPRLSMAVRKKGIRRSDTTEAAEKLLSVADSLEARYKPESAQKVREIAARVTIQQQNEIDGFPIE